MTTAAHPTDAILGVAQPIVALREQIRRLAAFDAPRNPHVPTVLLCGETGTGKGLLARVMHDSGPRAGAPFVDVNCAAIPEAMLEAELFGFEAGAFTDAKRSKPGLFEAASGGTLFLDEVDSLSPPVQGKVLKAIEEKRVRRLGAVAARDVDVKLVTATQRDLPSLVATGGFRADLYHRLAVLVLVIPPLRERPGDVLLLAEHFLAAYAAAHGVPPKRLTDDGRAWLTRLPFGGNVRELGHLLERVMLLAPGEVVDADTLGGLAVTAPLPPSAVASPPAAPAVAPMDAAAVDEARRIEAALARAGGNVVRAARALGLGRNALRYRMRRLGIERPALLDDWSLEARPAAPAPRAPVAAGAAEPSAWEQKSVAVLALSLTFPTDPQTPGYEPWTATRRWQRAITDRIAGFGGVFVQDTASRCLAIFGAPRALEQAPQRAAQAALSVCRAAAAAEAATAPEVRAAVHVGEVRLDALAADPTAHLFPIGDVFSLAERLLGHAGAGEVLVTPAAARRIERDFTVAQRVVQLGPVDADRIVAHTVAAPRRGAGSVEADGITRFVGRDRELDLLVDAFHRAAAGQGRVVLLAGEAGIGKSRLLAELRQRLAGEPHRWIEGRCASYGATTPFLPVIDALRRDAGIDDRDDERSAGAKIEANLAALGADLAWALPYMQQLLSLPVDDEAVRALDAGSRRSELFRALRACLMRAAEQAPLVVVVEDLHWADPASIEWLVFLADVIPATRALLVVSHRTGARPPFPDRSYHVHVGLAPLSGTDMAAMTGSILGAEAVPAALGELIAGKAEGNPFFVEELVRSLLEDGSLRRDGDGVALTRRLEELAVPDTIQDVLIARIDRLADDSRRAIQVASVIGREFALRLLARISEAGDLVRSQVEELRSLELIYEKALHPELAYMFKHALIHDVAYESVVAERRRRLHGTIGRAIEELYADRLAEHVETLAHHFGRAEDWPQALRYLEQSAEKAAETHASRAVVEHCRAALAIADRADVALDDATRARFEERLALAYCYLNDFVASAAAYEAAAGHVADDATRAMHLAAAGYSYFWGHRYAEARRCNDEALALSRQHGVVAGEAFATTLHGFYDGVEYGDLDTYTAESEAALATCRTHPHPLVEAYASLHLMEIGEWTGDYPGAIVHAEHSLTLGRALRRPEILVFCNWFLGKARCCLGDLGGALALLEDGYNLCDRIGDRAWKSRLLNTLGWCFAEMRSVERARECNEAAALLARDIGDPEILSNADINLALNHLALGEWSRADALVARLESTLSRPGDPWLRWRYSLHVHDARARLDLARGAPDAALTALDQELAGARRHHAPKLEGRALLQRGVALLALERPDDAEASLRDALAIAERIGYARGVADAANELATLARRAGRSAEADAHAARAADMVHRLAATLTDPTLRRRLEG
ncbi:MAG TPA: sigma 54-interacting transcriptional regulator [Candidatus Dormibacteraeota bacterium]|nr:sigma 54-interacting transcriptional regulator [Candidatus Dormibacteraeota bacterium]